MSEETKDDAPAAPDMKKCPGCGALIESGDVAHFDIHGDLAERIARLEAEKRNPENPAEPIEPAPEEPKKKSRFDFTTYHWED